MVGTCMHLRLGMGIATKLIGRPGGAAGYLAIPGSYPIGHALPQELQGLDLYYQSFLLKVTIVVPNF